MEGKEGRTERATPKRRSDAREKGQLCVSAEITTAGVLLVALFILRFWVPHILRTFCIVLSEVMNVPVGGQWEIATIRDGLVRGGSVAGGILLPVFSAAVIGSIIANMSQTGPYFSVKALRFRLSALNPITGFKRLFSLQSFVKLVLALMKIALVSLVITWMVRRKMPEMTMLSHFSTEAFAQWTFLFLYRMTLTVLLIFIVIAALDWCEKKYKYERDLMMTKQEVKDERRQYEQSPIVRGAQKRKMRELTLMRMMAAVPHATVVVTNPTHVAVALKYDTESMDAPRVVAKGLRLIAERIKQVAGEHGVPILERPALARSLYKDVPLGNEIPSRFYEAVAEILAYLHRLGQLRLGPIAAAPRPGRRAGRVRHGSQRA
ncbi:MAG: EscU/YscU/HrcU family type III secretion system export apparatus switch protein [Kiritimatiellae bacterium]|nr:EscU/YscU/HrcU family type III secretion system export apparatus switch protein [Kiritimatiellia bacterium]